MQHAALQRGNKTLLDLDVSDCELGMKSLVSITAALNESNSTLQAIGLENPRLATEQEVGLSLPGGVRLFTWTIPAVIN
jgi:hypothetical protein